MIFLSLPYFYENLEFNNILKQETILCRQRQNNFFKIPIEIINSYGSLPFSFWNGDLNNNYNSNKLLLYNDINNIISKSYIPIRLDCSNIYLEDKDFQDTHQNIILSLMDNSNNYIELSNINLYNYINQQFNSYNFIFSKKADLIHPLTIDIINTILEQNLFYLINLPDRFKNDINFLKSITNKNKIEITIGNRCSYKKCNQLNYCAKQEQLNQIMYSGLTNYNCNLTNCYNNNDELIQEINFFYNLGFNHFKIEAPTLDKNLSFKIYLINNLINSKYQLQLINKILSQQEK